MTPKEDAEKLIKKYISICQRWNEDVVNSKTIKELKEELIQLEWFIPKQCALIAVDEVLYCLNMSHDNVYFYNPEYEYYKQVKQETENL